MTIYLAGRVLDATREPLDGMPWAVIGIYSTEQLAIDACKDWRDFVFPMTIDETAPEQTEIMPGAFYPKSELPT